MDFTAGVTFFLDKLKKGAKDRTVAVAWPDKAFTISLRDNTWKILNWSMLKCQFLVCVIKLEASIRLSGDDTASESQALYSGW